MSSSVSITELRTMQVADLRKEIRTQRTEVQKMRIQITMNTEKDTAKYRREKRQLSRMLTVLTEKEKVTEETLKQKPKIATVSARAKSRGTSKTSS